MDCGLEFHVAATGCTGFPPMALPPAPSERRRVLQAHRLERINRYVEANLDDPKMSAQTAARALGMSVRSLHMALDGTSHSFGELVLRRRLELCRALLSQWDRAENVADLAFACGFNSLSSFYRAFRRHFGTCPREVRGVA
jgi:transcriptional regulator GlxA family with amidase domain